MPKSQNRAIATISISNRNKNLGPPSPQGPQPWKKKLVHCGKCRGFFVKFVAAIFPGNRRTKLCELFRQISLHFTQSSSKNFARTLLWGIVGTIKSRDLKSQSAPRKKRKQPNRLLNRLKSSVVKIRVFSVVFLAYFQRSQGKEVQIASGLDLKLLAISKSKYKSNMCN